MNVSSPSLPTPVSAGITVLVVDDDEFVRNVVSAQLRTFGAGPIRVAEDGRQAREALRAPGSIELIVCDLMMPGTDGVELMREIAELQPGASLILMSSADAKLLRGAEQLARSRRVRVLGALPKPVQPAALRALVNLLRRAADELPVMARPTEASEAEVCAAIQAQQLHIVVQPKLCLATDKLEGAEALVRVTLPPNRLIMPDRFLGVAERCGLMDAVTDQVMRLAIAAAGEWRRQNLASHIAINVPASSLARLGLPEQIAELAAQAGVPLSDVVVEVTETGVLQDLVNPLDVLMRLRLRGIGVSIDDFGTGYSSLERLQNFPFTELKVDRSFVAKAAHDLQARRIVESSLRLARDLGLRSVAEGVETRADLELMRELGCDIAQGYYVARPMPPADLPGWAARLVLY